MIIKRKNQFHSDHKRYPDNFKLEQSYPGPVAGVDEVGYGPWAGPVMAAAAILWPAKLPLEIVNTINDSKKLTPLKRQYLFNLFQEHQGQGIIWAVGSASVEEISLYNIRGAALMAMQRAVKGLSLQPQTTLIDGIVAPVLPGKTVIIKRGDSLSLSIGAASIIAKVVRDTLMQRLALEYPGYSWETNVGYGTAAHHLALQRLGVTPHHRKTFKPIAQLLSN